ncbi:hypothetical protein DAI22_05g044550 [Oryza sativa Japonica Group]|nr:hypothetical protein DAI22_05g044550 [Oryza sativa Japonica Group]
MSLEYVGTMESSEKFQELRIWSRQKKRVISYLLDLLLSFGSFVGAFFPGVT